MKRQRGRSRKPSSGSANSANPNRSWDSQGPENIKVRGNAQTVYERYQQLARDAGSSGDRVLAENYLQHAEHYFRVLRALQPQRPVSEIAARELSNQGFDIDFEDETGAQAAAFLAAQQAADRAAQGQQNPNNQSASGHNQNNQNNSGGNQNGGQGSGSSSDRRDGGDQGRDTAPREDRQSGDNNQGARPESRRERWERQRDERRRSGSGESGDASENSGVESSGDDRSFPVESEAKKVAKAEAASSSKASPASSPSRTPYRKPVAKKSDASDDSSESGDSGLPSFLTRATELAPDNEIAGEASVVKKPAARSRTTRKAVVADD